MIDIIVLIVLGVMLLIIGILNSHGNISSLHWYHRHRVSDDDKHIFGKIVGTGTIIIGGAIIIYGLLLFVEIFLKDNIFAIIGLVILTVAIIVGLILMFYAMIKYNKGIF